MLVDIFLAVTLTRLIHAKLKQLNGDAQTNAIGVVFDIVMTNVTVCVNDPSNPAKMRNSNTLRTEQRRIHIMLRKNLPPDP